MEYLAELLTEIGHADARLLSSLPVNEGLG